MGPITILVELAEMSTGYQRNLKLYKEQRKRHFNQESSHDRVIRGLRHRGQNEKQMLGKKIDLIAERSYEGTSGGYSEYAQQ